MRRLIFLFAVITAVFQPLYAGVTLYRDLPGHSDSVSCADFSPNNNYLATSDLSGEIRVWDYSSGTLLLSIKHGAPVESVAFSPDSKYIATGARDNTVKIWEVVGGGLIKTFEDFKTPVFSVVFSPDGKLLAGGSDKKIIIWGIKELRKYQEIRITNAWARSLRFSPDGKRLAAACGDTVELWKVGYNDMISKLLRKGGVSFQPARSLSHGTLVYTIAYSKDSQTIASAGESGEIKAWRAEDGYLKWSSDELTGIIWSLSFSPDVKLLAAGGKDALVRIYDAADGKLVNTIAGQEDEVYSVAFSYDGRVLAETTRDKNVKLWNVALNLDKERLARNAGIAITAIILVIFVLIGARVYRKEKAKVKHWKP